MALSRKQLKNLVANVIEEYSSVFEEEEVQELAGSIADRIVEVDTDAYDDADEADPIGMDEHYDGFETD